MKYKSSYNYPRMPSQQADSPPGDWAELPHHNIISDNVHVSSPDKVIQFVQANVNNIISDQKNKSCIKQIYLNFSFGQYRKIRSALALLDTGSDLNLISQNYLELYLPSWEDLPESEDSLPENIFTASGEKMSYIGYKKLKLYIAKNIYVELNFAVMPDSLFGTKCIISRDIFTQLKASLIYNQLERVAGNSGDCEDHFYSLLVAEPGVQRTVQLLHLSIPGIFVVFARCVTFKPREKKTVTFELRVNPFITSETDCLVTPSNEMDSRILWLPTKCKPFFKRNGIFTVILGAFNPSHSESVSLKYLTAHLETLPANVECVRLLSNKTQSSNDPEASRRSNRPDPDTQGRHAYVRQITKHPPPGLTDSRPHKLPDKLLLGQGVDEKVKGPVQPGKKTDLGFQALVAHINHGPNRKHTPKNCLYSFKTEGPIQNAQFVSNDTYQCCNIRVHNGEEIEEIFQPADELLSEEIMPAITLPEIKHPSPAEVVKLETYEERIQPYLKDIFLDSFPSIVGVHNLDTGPVIYLGKIKLRPKPGYVLPKHSKVYNLNQTDQGHMNDILDFMCTYDFIEEVFQDDPDRPSAPWGAPCYLVMRKPLYNPDGTLGPNSGHMQMMRLIIDYSLGLNKVLEDTPALVKGIEDCIESLRGGYLYSLLDLKQSYYGLVIDPASSPLTQFVAPPGRSFVWKRLPMGMSSAPASLLEKTNLIFNYVPLTDDEGNVVFEKGEDPTDLTSKAVLVENKLENVITFYDDILVYTKKSKHPECPKHYEKSLEEHFDYVKAVVERMALFQLKITFHKCSWAKRYVDFLGWRIQDDVIYADEKRISKVQKFDYPTTRKSLLGFLGLVNTLKRVSPLSVGEEIAVLSEVTSTKNKFNFEEKHKTAFDNIKTALVTPPLFCHMIDPSKDKIIFVDSSGLAYGSVLLSRVDHNVTNEPTFSSHIQENDPDPLHQVILKWKLQLYVGEKYPEAPDSLFKSVLFLIKYHNLNFDFTNTLELRQAVLKHVRKSFVGQQLRAKTCDGRRDKFNDFLFQRVGDVNSTASPTDVVIYLLASFLNRGINVYLAQPDQKECPLHEFLSDSRQVNAPFNIGVYCDETDEIGYFVPLMDFKAWQFNPALLNSKYVVNFYDSKIIPKNQRSKNILELECIALLVALKKYRQYITGCRTHIVTDNRSLFYLFSNAIVLSHAKVSRYNLKLQSDFPNVRIMWCNSETNLADLFSRFGLETEYETKIKFNHYKIDELPEIPSGLSFGWHEFAQIVNCHPKVVKILLDYSKTYETKNQKKLELIKKIYEDGQEVEPTMQRRSSRCAQVIARACRGTRAQSVLPKSQGPYKSEPLTDHDSSLLQFSSYARNTLQPQGFPPAQHTVNFTRLGKEQVSFLVVPIQILRDRLSKENIGKEQHHALTDLYMDLLKAEKGIIREKLHYFILIDNVIYAVKYRHPETYLLVIPSVLEPMCLALVHLAHGHLSITQMLQEVKSSYFFYEKEMDKRIRLFGQSCTACSINARDPNKVALANFSIDPDATPFSCIVADLAENLSKFLKKFEHLLIIKCVLTSYTLVFPLKRKSAEEIAYHFLFGVIQHFGPCKNLFSDNASVFRHQATVALLASLNVNVRDTTQLDPKSRGLVESTVFSVKDLVKKMLSAHENRADNRADILPLLASLNLNCSYNTRVGGVPYALVFGREFDISQIFGTPKNQPTLHPVLRNSVQEVSQLKAIVAHENNKVRDYIAKAQARAKKSVKRPVVKVLPAGTLVFVLDQSPGPVGVSRAWKTAYMPSIFIVLREYSTHVTLLRISDKLVTNRSKNAVKMCKKYERLNELPPDVQKTLSLSFTELTQAQLEKLASFDSFGSFKYTPTDEELPADWLQGELQSDLMPDPNDWFEGETADKTQTVDTSPLGSFSGPGGEESDSEEEEEEGDSSMKLRSGKRVRIAAN